MWTLIWMYYQNYAVYPEMSTIFSKNVCKQCLHACDFFHVCSEYQIWINTNNISNQKKMFSNGALYSLVLFAQLMTWWTQCINLSQDLQYLCRLGTTIYMKLTWTKHSSRLYGKFQWGWRILGISGFKKIIYLFFISYILRS